MKAPVLKKEQVTALAETKFLNTYDINYAEGRHYYVSTRRNVDTMTAVKSMEEVDTMLPDAVTCYIIIHSSGKEDRLLMQYEYRFPIGQYVMCPPAGILDPADKADDNPLIVAARREIFEETGIKLSEKDELYVINDLVFSTPGFTDECNALVCAEVYLDDPEAVLNHDAAEETEYFGDFVLLTKDECKALLKSGRDPQGHRYPLYAYAAMAFFALR